MCRFVGHVQRYFHCFQAVGTAVDTFLMVLDTHKWTSMPSMAARSRGRSSSSADPAAAASSDAAAPSPAANGAHGGDPSTPPYALMDHVPLAIFVNGLLSAFNELRHCAPLSLATALASILQVCRHLVYLPLVPSVYHVYLGAWKAFVTCFAGACQPFWYGDAHGAFAWMPSHLIAMFISPVAAMSGP